VLAQSRGSLADEESYSKARGADQALDVPKNIEVKTLIFNEIYRTKNFR
jgi:hypothetical protein